MLTTFNFYLLGWIFYKTSLFFKPLDFFLNIYLVNPFPEYTE